MLVLSSGEIEGTIGGGAIEFEVMREALRCLEQGEDRMVERHLVHDLGMCCGGAMEVFVEVQRYSPRCYVFGCGHVGWPLAMLAARCGFETVAIDGRPEFASTVRFGELSGLSVCCDDPLGYLEDMDPEGAYVVVLTHDHGLDEEIVAKVLGRGARYLGCIGSTRKGLMFRQRLEARGFDEAAVEELRTPMGVDVGAQTPDEIAVSIVAELVRVRRLGGGGG
jgi:xanthine dehydrogenase accessory factor